MPLIIRQKYKNTDFFIYKIDKNQDFFSKNIVLHPFDEEKLSKLKNPNQILCFWAIRKLLSDLFLYEHFAYYQEKIPILNNHQSISLSHSFPFVAISVSSKKTGIDIEKITPKIEFIAPKFTNIDTFYSHSSEKKQKIYTQIWTIKEALFKAGQKKGVDFKNDLILENFNENHQENTATFKQNNHNENYFIFSGEMDNYIFSVVEQF